MQSKQTSHSEIDNAPVTRVDALIIALETTTGILSRLDIKAKNEEDPIFIERVSELTGYQKSTIYQLIHKREIPFHKTAGRRRLYFFESELIEWIRSGKNQAAQNRKEASHA